MAASPGGLYTQTLEGDEALALLSTLTRAIREARIRDSFPSGRRLQDLMDALAAGGSSADGSKHRKTVGGLCHPTPSGQARPLPGAVHEGGVGLGSSNCFVNEQTT